MDALFQIQLPIMVFFQNIATPIMDLLAQVITVFGESPIPLLVTIYIYWCLSKEKGFVIISSLMSAMMSMQILKAIFRIPRPFMRYPELIQGKRQSTATGFSFPSGHSTTASGFYGSLVYCYKSKILKIICIALIVLVPISRLYLGAHWPLDVIIGTLNGLLFSIAMGKIFASIYKNKKLLFNFAIIFSICAFVLSLALSISMDVLASGYESIALFKESSFYRAVHNLMQNGSIASGLFLGIVLDQRLLNFKPAQSNGKRIASFIVGLVLAAVIAALLSLIPVAKYTVEFSTYLLIGLWATYLFPLIACKFGLMERDRCTLR